MGGTCTRWLDMLVGAVMPFACSMTGPGAGQPVTARPVADRGAAPERTAGRDLAVQGSAAATPRHADGIPSEQDVPMHTLPRVLSIPSGSSRSSSDWPKPRWGLRPRRRTGRYRGLSRYLQQPSQCWCPEPSSPILWKKPEVLYAPGRLPRTRLGHRLRGRHAPRLGGERRTAESSHPGQLGRRPWPSGRPSSTSSTGCGPSCADLLRPIHAPTAT